MSINEENTKEKIAEVALGLFAQKGFAAVSIRDICKQVGIKESTIYYHYKNKQDILDSLIHQLYQFIDEKRDIFDARFALAKEVSTKEMELVAVGFLRVYLLNPLVYKMICMLSIERMHSADAQKIYDQIVFELPMEQQTKVFGQMMERGFIKKGDVNNIAEEYYSIIYTAFQRRCLGECSEQDIMLASEQIMRGIHRFYENLMI